MIAASEKADFKDWLSPMLVKELRQGLRSRVFVAAFYLSQALMILSTVLQISSTSATSNQAEWSGFMNAVFWFLIGIPLLFVMPLRGLAALHSEIKSGTLELVFLTRLSAWKITAGKWLALIVQTVLLICSILPYVVLRYFVGGVDLIDDAQKILFLLAGSAVMTAATVALSPYENKLVRALFVLGMIFAVQFIAGIFVVWLTVGQLNPTGPVPWVEYLAGVVFVGAFILLALQMAASKIAPPAENHALVKRLIGLGAVVCAAAFAFSGTDFQIVFGAALFFLIPILVDALAEPVRFVRNHFTAFDRLGKLGRGVRVFFLPGWISGLWYTLLIGGLLIGCAVVKEGSVDTVLILVIISFLGGVIFPAALLRLMVATSPNFLGLYIAVQFLFAALTALVGIIGGISDQPYQWWLSWLPPCVMWLSVFGLVSGDEVMLFVLVTGFMTIVSVLFLILRSLAPSRDIRAQLRQSATSHV